jgi:hypothetical protein
LLQHGERGDDLVEGAGFERTVGRAELVLLVDDQEAVAVDDGVVGGAGLGGDEELSRQCVGLVLGAGHEVDARIGGAAFVGVLFEDIGGVVFRVYGEADEADVGVIHPFGECDHALGHDGAGAGAAGEDEVGDPDVALEVFGGEGVAAVVGEGELGDLGEDRQRLL